MMSWGGFSYKANKIGTSPLHLLNKGEETSPIGIYHREYKKMGFLLTLMQMDS